MTHVHTIHQSLHFDDKCTHMVVDLLGKKEKVLCAILAGVGRRRRHDSRLTSI